MVESFAATQLKTGARVLHVVRPGRAAPLVGFDVTTVDESQLGDVTDAFDAVVFTDSLSSAVSLQGAIENAARVTAPNGRLIVEDIDLAAPDAMSLRWFYDVQELLAVTGALHQVHASNTDLVARWRAALDCDGVVHSGTHMRVAVSSRFVIRELRRVEGFYRLLASAPAIDAHVRYVERRSIASDTVMPIGLRIVAERAARD